MTMVETTTDENGQFVIQNVSLDDRISITIQKNGYEKYEADLNLSEVIDGNLSISLTPLGGGNYLTLLVKTQYNNTPIENVNVGLCEKDNLQNMLVEGVTDSNGECTLTYTTGEYTLIGGSSDYQFEEPINITLDEDKTINVTLIEKAEITDPPT